MNIKRIIKPIGFGAITLSIIPLVSCNITLKRNRKYNQIKNADLFNSAQGKNLLKLIQNNFSKEFLKNSWTNYFSDNVKKADKKMVIGNLTIQQGEYYSGKMPILSKVSNEFEAKRALTKTNVRDGTPRGNYARDIFSSVEWDIMHNRFINQNIRSLMNQMLTTYNRSKKIYPIKAEIVEHNGIKFIKYTFRVDLTSPLDRRYMKKYTELIGECPLVLPTSAIVKKVYNNKDYKSTKNSDLLFDSIFQNWGSKNNWLISETEYVDNATYDNTIIDFKRLKVKITTNSKTNEKTYKIYAWFNKGGVWKQYLVSELKDQDKLIKLISDIKSKLFLQNEKIPLVKNIFNDKDGWNVNIDVQSNSGTTIKGLTAKDYFKNLLKYSKYTVYMKGKIDNGLEYYFTGNMSIIK